MTTFLEFGQIVLERRAAQGIRGIRSERHRWAIHLATSSLASMPLNEIRARHIRAWIRDMGEKKARDTRGERPLSPASIKRSFALLSSIFTAAIEEELVESNPCNGVKVPKRCDERATKDDLTYLSVDEQKAIVECDAIPVEHRIAIRFALSTGLRQGEQMALRIADVHLDDEAPYVYVRYGSPFLPPKSGKARRVPLFGDGLAAARDAIAYAQRLTHNPHGLVFPTPRGSFRGVGKPLGRAKIKGKNVCAWKDALKRAGVRDIKWHSLRHTAATNLVTGALGRRWTLEEVQPLLGHSSITITQIYGKVGDDALKRAARETAPVEMPPELAANSVFAEGASRVRTYVWRALSKVRDYRARRAARRAERRRTA